MQLIPGSPRASGAGSPGGLLRGLDAGLRALLGGLPRLLRGLPGGLHALLGDLAGGLHALLGHLGPGLHELLVEGHRGVQEVRVGVGGLLDQRLHGRLLALGLVGEGLGHLLHRLRLLLELLHGALEDLLGELHVALHDGYGLIAHRLQGLRGPLRHLLRGLVHVLHLALIHVLVLLAVARKSRVHSFMSKGAYPPAPPIMPTPKHPTFFLCRGTHSRAGRGNVKIISKGRGR